NDRDVVEPDAGEPHASSSQSTWPGKALQGRPVPQEASLFEKHLTGVVIWPHQVDNDELSSIVDKNYEYGAHLHEGVLKGGDNIRNGTIKSFADLWNYATDVRTSVPNFDASKMALFRSPQKVDSDLATPLNGQYDYIRGCVKNHPMFVRKSPVWESTLAMHGDIPDANGQTQRVDLTKFSPVGSPTMGRDWERGYITHTLPNQHPPIRKHLERLYREAMDAPDDATFKDKAARLYWWSAHACFDQRGSAAKTEIAFRSMYQARGLHCPLWQPGVSADVEAMLCLEDEWVEKHEQLMLSEDALVRESEKIDPMEWADMALKREVGE
ncbi:MAG TPA: hypothetical protein VFS42_02175, partial [Burkholderiaceae bacterium]|nr:hypothetical protein [Burkholderiaceae bacterium]